MAPLSNEENFFAGLQARPGFSASGGRRLEQPLFKQPAPLTARKQPRMRLGWGHEEWTSATAAAPHTPSVHEDDLGDDPASLALADLTYQVNFFSYERRKGVNSTPFAVAYAPQQAHTAFDSTTSPPGLQEACNVLVQDTDATSTTLLTSSQQPASPNALNCQPETSAYHEHSVFAADNTKDSNTASIKRAAMIAKAKSNPPGSTGGILTSKSAMQKRAAQQKNRNRRPILDTPAPPHQQEKPGPKPSSQVMIRYENTLEGHHTDLTLAIKEGLVDPDNDEDVKRFMEAIRETANKETNGETDELDEHVTADGDALGVINQDADDNEVEGSGERVMDEADTRQAPEKNDKKKRSKGKGKKGAK